MDGSCSFGLLYSELHTLELHPCEALEQRLPSLFALWSREYCAYKRNKNEIGENILFQSYGIPKNFYTHWKLTAFRIARIATSRASGFGHLCTRKLLNLNRLYQKKRRGNLRSLTTSYGVARVEASFLGGKTTRRARLPQQLLQ